MMSTTVIIFRFIFSPHNINPKGEKHVISIRGDPKVELFSRKYKNSTKRRSSYPIKYKSQQTY